VPHPCGAFAFLRQGWDRDRSVPHTFAFFAKGWDI
jgi:hypothetical protein